MLILHHKPEYETNSGLEELKENLHWLFFTSSTIWLEMQLVFFGFAEAYNFLTISTWKGFWVFGLFQGLGAFSILSGIVFDYRRNSNWYAFVNAMVAILWLIDCSLIYDNGKQTRPEGVSFTYLCIICIMSWYGAWRAVRRTAK